jgi:hypothetical protein
MTDLPVPNARAISEATEADAKLALQHPTEACDWELFDQSFIVSAHAMVIARIDGIGTGYPHVVWAMKYQNIFSMQRDWEEIKSVPQSITTDRRKP